MKKILINIIGNRLKTFVFFIKFSVSTLEDVILNDFAREKFVGAQVVSQSGK